jgi:predicted ArsR family transcriptional regulator
VDEPQRTAILEELRQEPAGLDVSQLATRIGLHPNTIRWHLGRLGDAGLVRSTPAHRGRPGRPRIVYSATSGTAPEGESYRFLAELLASALARAAEGERAVEEAGRAWGGYLVERPTPSLPLTTDEAAGRIVDLLATHGFAPRRVGDAIEMRRCPFQELVEAYGNVVCGLHRGLLAGALEALDAGVELTTLEPYPEPGLCRATFAAT